MIASRSTSCLKSPRAGDTPWHLADFGAVPVPVLPQLDVHKITSNIINIVFTGF